MGVALQARLNHLQCFWYQERYWQYVFSSTATIPLQQLRLLIIFLFLHILEFLVKLSIIVVWWIVMYVVSQF